ncbi:MFS transporter [Actinomadura sp. ATCC 31491]|uniref:MFS transporter n=1 Tax=Actinomadura luzonensis TaxID=2805427 RepID=A0ABT0FSQ2_9ACTN|nr:MFS transporter [Actinomadura luzonensis]MCK2215379.1 MFS transporter [Actinomadura luzonensis]
MSPFASLARPRLLTGGPFRWFLGARLLSMAGDHLFTVALAFAVLEAGHPAAALGAVVAAGLVPKIVLTPLAGTWCDRLDRRLVLVAGDLVAAAATAAVAAVVVAGGASVPVLVLLAALLGAATAFFDPAAMGLIAEIVPEPRRRQANASLGLVSSAAMIAGPALAGVLVALLGPAPVIAADAVSFALSAALLARIDRPRPARPAAARRSLLGDLGEGWREFARQTWLWLLTAQFAVYVCGGLTLFTVLGPVIARDRLGGASAWGLIQAGLGVGYLAGRLVSFRFRPARPALAACLLVAATVPGNVALACAGSPLPVLLGQALTGWALAVYATLWSTLVTGRIPEDRLSRVVAADQAISLTTLPLASAAVAALAAVTGYRAALVGGAAATLLVTALVARTRAIGAVRDAPT